MSPTTLSASSLLHRRVRAENRSKKFRVLVVEDCDETRRLICTLLRQFTFGPEIHPLEAVNGAEGLTLIKTTEVDAVLADWAMPTMNGLEMLKEIRRGGKSKDVPVIMLTAVAKEGDVIEAIGHGLTGYILKPFTIQAVEEKLKVIYQQINNGVGSESRQRSFRFT
jgi:two-component system chemotaxis response regulator CheY